MTDTQPEIHADIEWATGRNAETLLAELAKAGLTIVRDGSEIAVLVESGLLSEERRTLLDGMAGMTRDANGHAWFCSKPGTQQVRYVTAWKTEEGQR